MKRLSIFVSISLGAASGLSQTSERPHADLLLGEGPWLSAKEQEYFKKFWPDSVDLPAGLKFYRRTKHSQSISITNNFDAITPYTFDRDDIHGKNPNRTFPWKVPGGLDRVTGWISKVAVVLPKDKKIRGWAGRAYPQGAQITGLAKHFWSFPDGTNFYDMLIHDGACFELRQRERRNGKWISSVPHRSEQLPAGYEGPGKACSSCHNRAGEESYGTAVRGSDGVFSAPILVEGRVDFDTKHWPIDRQSVFVPRYAPLPR